MADRTLCAALRAAASSTKGVVFVDRSEREVRIGYAALFLRAKKFAGGLRALGLRRGDRAALILPTGPGFFDAFFGTLLAGGVPVPLYPPVRLGRLDEYHERTSQMLRACGARVVLTDRRIRRLLGRSIDRARPELGCLPLGAIERGGEATVTVGPDDLAFIQFSSGTTAAPKPVALTHRQVLSNIRALLGAILEAYPEGPTREHVGVSWLPLYHDMGLVGSLLSAVFHPGELVLIPPEVFITRPALWLRAISRHRGSISPAPHFAYSLCLDRIRDDELEGVDLSSWVVALDGAEPVTPHVLERFVERFSSFGLHAAAPTPVYGLAESALAVTFSELKAPFRSTRFDREALLHEGRAIPSARGQRLVSVGRPLPGFSVRIVDDTGIALSEGQLGSVQVRGPSLMTGYLGMPKETDAALGDGWLDTGDRGFLHSGELHLFGRAKDMVILRGRNYAPQDIEQALDELESIRTGCSAAIGVVAENADTESLVILAERARGCHIDAESIAAQVRRQVVDRTGLVPARTLVLQPGTLPRTSSGKIRRADARQLYLMGRLRAPERVHAARVAREMVRSYIGLARARRSR